MFEAFLATTSTEGLQPLGSAAQRSFELVHGAVRQRLGDRHAAIFAEPVAAQHGDSIDWHAGIQGRAQRLSDLPEADREGVKAALGVIVSEIRSEAETLALSNAADDQRLSEALSNATEIPDERMIWTVRSDDGELYPVLVHWAWIRDEQRAVRGVLSAMVPHAAPPMPAQTPVDRGNRSPIWLWLIALGWLLLAGLIGAILYVLIAPCGIQQGRLLFCPADPAEIESALTESRIAADEVAALERELALVNRQCHPTIPIQPELPEIVPEDAPEPEDDAQKVPTEEDRDAVTQRITERGARRGKLNFTLEWSSIDDIDLYVTCPTGATVSYRNKGDCNGTYDLDANVVAEEAISDPVENIVFDEALVGIYKVRAHLRSERTSGPKTVILHVLRQDGPSQSYRGMVGSGQSEWITNISISR